MPDADFALALEACAGGDRAALRRLYDRLAPSMVGVAVRMLRRRELAEEVVHDTFLKIWEKASSFDPARGHATTWMFAILRNHALNVLRTEKRTDLVEDFEPMALTGTEPDAEAVMEALSEAGALRRCLQTLEPQRRDLVVLAYTRGLSHSDLAGRLSVPLGTVKSWIRRSLLSLRECMA